MNDDAVLLRRYVAEKSEEAFAELVRRHLGFVYAAAVRRLNGDSHGAADVTQSVFIKLARDASKLSQHSALAGWLYTTTRNAAVDRVRVEQHRKAREQEVAAMQESVPSSEPEKEWERVRPLLDATMDELDERDRSVILLRFFAGHRFSDIGVALRISEDAARMRADRALEKLHGLLKRRGVTSSATALGVVLANQAVATAAAIPAGLGSSVTNAALAGLAKGGGATAAIGIMSTSKTAMTVGGALLLCGLLGTAVREDRRAAEAQLSVESFRKETARLEARLAETRRLAQLAERDAAEWTAKLAAAQAERTKAVAAARPTVAAPPPGREPNWDPVAAGRGLMERHPELKRAVVARADAITNFVYAPMFRELGFTPAQEQAYRELMREYGGITTTSSGPRGETYSLHIGSDMPKEAVDAQRLELLGEAGYARFGEFVRLNEARTAVAKVAAGLVFSDTPISSEQAQRLAGVMMATVRPPGGTEVGQFDWNEITSRASTVLSSPQMEALAAVRAERERQRVSPLAYPTSPSPGGSKK